LMVVGSVSMPQLCHATGVPDKLTMPMGFQPRS
jgi:hypothetical protein